MPTNNESFARVTSIRSRWLSLS